MMKKNTTALWVMIILIMTTLPGCGFRLNFGFDWTTQCQWICFGEGGNAEGG